MALVHHHCESYLEREVKPHVPDAWIDCTKAKVGYEIPINRHFYVYQPSRPLHEIGNGLYTLEGEIIELIRRNIL